MLLLLFVSSRHPPRFSSSSSRAFALTEMFPRAGKFPIPILSLCSLTLLNIAFSVTTTLDDEKNDFVVVLVLLSASYKERERERARETSSFVKERKPLSEAKRHLGFLV